MTSKGIHAATLGGLPAQAVSTFDLGLVPNRVRARSTRAGSRVEQSHGLSSDLIRETRRET